MDVELRQLRYFVAVAEERHFGRAADLLGIAQPGLSRQIMALERAIGAQLLERDKRHVALTRAGETFLYYARLAIELTDRGLDCARMTSKGKTAVLKVGSHHTGTPPLGIELFRVFSEEHPEVQVEYLSGLVPQAIERLVRREVDIAIVIAPFDAPRDVRYLALDSHELMLMIPSRHPLAELDQIPRCALLNETFLGFPRESNPRFVDYLNRALFGDKQPHAIVEVPALAETERLLRVAAGEGITVGPASVAELGMSQVVLRPLEEPRLMLEYGLAWLDSSVSPFVAKLVQIASRLATPCELP